MVIKKSCWRDRARKKTDWRAQFFAANCPTKSWFSFRQNDSYF